MMRLQICLNSACRPPASAVWRRASSGHEGREDTTDEAPLDGVLALPRVCEEHADFGLPQLPWELCATSHELPTESPDAMDAREAPELRTEAADRGWADRREEHVDADHGRELGFTGCSTSALRK